MGIVLILAIYMAIVTQIVELRVMSYDFLTVERHSQAAF